MHAPKGVKPPVNYQASLFQFYSSSSSNISALLGINFPSRF